MENTTKSKLVGTLWIIYIFTAAIVGMTGIVKDNNNKFWTYYGVVSLLLILFSYLLYAVF